jgi:flagellar basal-body rod protein FlgB
MAINDLPLMSMLRTRMRWHNQRQSVLAENVANADTAGFRSRDLRPLALEARQQGPNAPVRTDPRHVSRFGATAQPNLEPRRVASFETTPRGNSVVLEDEMVRIGQNAQDFQAAASLYQRGLGLLRTAIGKRG